MKNVIIVGCYEGVTDFYTYDKHRSEFTSRALAADIDAVAKAVAEKGYKAYSVCLRAPDDKELYKYYGNFLSENVTAVDAVDLPKLLPDCVAAIIVGAAAKAGTQNAFLDATYAQYVYNYFIDGKTKGEFGIYKTFFAMQGVPVIMGSGCRAACKEFAEEIDGVYTVETKVADVRRNAATAYPEAETREKLYKTAVDALKNLSKFTINRVDKVKIKIEYIREDYLEDSFYFRGIAARGAKRTDSRAVEWIQTNTDDVTSFLT